MSRIDVHRTVAPGFTLTELMIALSLLAIVCAAVISAYLFLGRNLTRLVNIQQQQVQSLRALRIFTQDLNTASQLTTMTPTQIVLAKPGASGTTTVTYTYAAPSKSTAANGTLTRTETVPPAVATTQTLLSGLTAFTFSYYDGSGAAITAGPQNVKSVEFTCTAAAGSSAIGTWATYVTVSPRVALRNKPILQ